MTTSLQQIREQLLKQEQKKENNFSGGGDNTVYPFWNIPENTTSTIRFLPDADESNIYFWRERQMIKIPFSGIVGQSDKDTIVTVPCVEMWNEKCPIHAEIRPWFKDPTMEDMARKYWKKRSYIFQGFVVEDALKEETPPENPIRRFIINTSVFNIIKSALMDPDFPEMPTDTELGTDFKLSKTIKGKYADYTTSNWARRERALSETEREAIATHGLFDLNEFMPKKPSDEEMGIIFKMFEDSLEGKPYDPAKYASFYRPYGLEWEGDKTVGSVNAQPASTPKESVTTSTDTKETVDTDDTPFTPDNDEPETKKSVEDILSAIRNRKSS